MTQASSARVAVSPAKSNSGASTAIHEEQTELEKALLPSWLDHDPAADEPNYLGYIMSILPALLIALLALAAIVLTV